MSTKTVTTNADAGAGSLRDLVTTAVIGDTILVPSSVGTISLLSAIEILVTDITIECPDVTRITIRIDDTFVGTNLLFSSNGSNIVIRNIIFSGSTIATSRCFFFNTAAGLIIEDCDVTGFNNVTNGIITFTNTLAFTPIIFNRVMINNNTTTGIGSAILINNAAAFIMRLTLTGCMISSNTSTGVNFQDTIFIETSGSATIDLVVNDCTIANNVGNGIRFAGTGNNSMTVSGTCINDNTMTGIYNTSTTFVGGIYNSTISSNGQYGMQSTIIGSPFNNVIFISNTIVGNTIAGIVNPEGTLATYILHNNIISGNLLSDVIGVLSSSSNNNLISNGTGMTGVVDGVDGNMVGTQLSPIDPGLGAFGNYGGNTNLFPLLLSSVAINAGNTSFTGGYDYDQRGSPYARIVGGTIDMGSFEYQLFPIPCYDGEALVTVRDGEIYVKDIRPGDMVYDVITDSYVEVIANAVIDGATRFVIIEKDSIAKNIPHTDLKITPGHSISIDDMEMKARDLLSTKKITTSMQEVYNICTEKRSLLSINGMSVYAWSYDKWVTYAQNKLIMWTTRTN